MLFVTGIFAESFSGEDHYVPCCKHYKWRPVCMEQVDRVGLNLSKPLKGCSIIWD